MLAVSSLSGSRTGRLAVSDFFSRVLHGRPLVPKTRFQRHDADCGPTCLALILDHLCRDYTSSLRSVPLMDHPASASDLVHLARDFGLEGTAFKVEPEDLPQLNLPLILHWRLNHWIVLWQIESDHYLVDDPARGRCWLDRTVIQTHFSGIAIEFIAESRDIGETLTHGHTSGHPERAAKNQRRHGAMMIFCTLVMAIFHLATPFAAKIMIDIAPLSHQVSVLLWLTSLYFASQTIALFCDRRLRHIVIDQSHHAWQEESENGLTTCLNDKRVGVSSARSHVPPLTQAASLALERKRLGLTAFLVLPAVLVMVTFFWFPATPFLVLDAAVIALIVSRQTRVQSNLRYAASGAKRHLEFEQGSLAQFNGMADRIVSHLGLQQRFRVRFKNLIDASKTLDITLLDHEIAQALWSAFIRASSLGLLVYGLMIGEVSMASFFLLANYHALYRQHWQAWWAVRSDTQTANSAAVASGEETDKRQMARDKAATPRNDAFTLAQLITRNPSVVNATDSVAATYWIDTSRFTSKTLQALNLKLDASDNPSKTAIHQALNVLPGPIQVCDFNCPLFDASLADHLTHFDLSPNADRLMNCLALMGLKEAVLSWPMGINTRLSPTGAPLDGIGRAKLALAACLYQASSVLIIDHRQQRLGLADVQNCLGAAVQLDHTVIYLSPTNPFPWAALSQDKLDTVSDGRRKTLSERL
jgi:ABC-type bacteriocin/lantibiotic exporter with double-glycine peptidase domain